MDAYLDLARQGKNAWWRYTLGVLLILGLWQVVGAFPLAAVFVLERLAGNSQAGIEAGGVVGVGPLLGFTLELLPSLFFLAGLFLAVRFIHGRPFRTLITPRPSLGWGRFWIGFGAWLIVVALTSLVEARLYPGRYVWTFAARQFIPLVILAVLLVPIQTSTEELFFRAYFLQGLGLRTRSFWLLCAASGFLFMVPHFLNPEASSNYTLMGLYYFSMGAFLAYLTLRDGSLELALGVHAANNLYSVLVANYSVTALPSPSLFTVQVVDAAYGLISALV
ncbi:MAG TPA: CPBP family intramembrane glutamic endopeptidase, partial [Anaerolineales bacterium]|nr:CPBP family intramembrane glutamic endopeptidase [Anaerolineales bacterium]